MNFNRRAVNRFLLWQVPSAYFSGVRLDQIDDESAQVHVNYQWINKNPFRSLYFSTQCMASELSTGVLIMKKIYASKRKISMLVTAHQGTFVKKAVGRIVFTCTQGRQIDHYITQAIETGEGQSLELQAIGRNEQGETVSRFTYQWSLKMKKS